MGCTDYSSAGVHVVTNDNIATVTCISTSESWEMTCVDGTWSGNEKYCGKHAVTKALSMCI